MLKHFLFIFAFVLMMGARASAQSYSLPNNNSGCPSNCRQISWVTGSDIWNSGVLPVYAQVTCTPLNENGSTDDTTNINNCINAASAGSGGYSTCHAAGGCAVFLPAGNIYVNGTVRLANNVALRGAQPEGVVPGVKWLPTADSGATNIILGVNGQLTTQNWSYTQLTPTTTYNGGAGCATSGTGTNCEPYKLSGTPQKGDTTVTISTGSVSNGTWITVFGNDDPTLITDNGTDGFCPWCGWNNGFWLMNQIVQVTNLAGSVATLSKPLYYPPYTTAVSNANGQSGVSEDAGANYRTLTFSTQKAGYENLRIDGSAHDIGNNSMVLMQGCLYCWVENTEEYVTGSSTSAHIEWDWSYGGETRNNYVHQQRSGAGGAGYGFYFQFPNGDMKIENNICRHSRHCEVLQAGTSGTAFLYNYYDDMYTDDATYLGSARSSHGAHDYFNLFEGNVMSHHAADDVSGTSSHDVFWRNWIWGDATMNYTGLCSGCQGAPNGYTGVQGYDAVDLYQSQEYYAYVGNVLGTSAIPTAANNSCAVTNTTARHAVWSAATLSTACTTNSCGYEQYNAPGVYSYGSSGFGSTAQSNTTIIRNGNYDYKTVGVAYWDGGTTNNTLATSLYYGSKPSFLGTCRWPAVGYDQSPVYGMNAAEATYLGANVGMGSSPVVAPAANLFTKAQ